MAGTLILCATPLGNLGDVSERLTETLAGADLIFAEDTRRTGTLLRHLGVSTPMRSFFTGNERSRLDELRRVLEDDGVVALVSDAGTPAVSDPGSSAVRTAIEAGADITAIPGPSAVTLAMAVSGFDGDRFVFDGFLPRKGRDRVSAIEEIRDETRTTVLFASPKRVAGDLTDLAHALEASRRVVVCREMTKLHEEVWRGTLEDACAKFSGADRQRGEFTLVIDGAEPVVPTIHEAVTSALEMIEGGMTTADAVRQASSSGGVSRREVYDEVLRTRQGGHSSGPSAG